MRPTHLMMLLTAIIIVSVSIGTVWIDEDSDAAINIGSLTGADNNDSSSTYAYGRIAINSQYPLDYDFIGNGETIYVLVGSNIRFVTPGSGNPTHVYLESGPDWGLDILQTTSNTRVEGTASSAGTCEFSLTSSQGSKTFYITAVTDTTVYANSVSISMSPTSPHVGDLVTFTATINPSNASKKDITWSWPSGTPDYDGEKIGQQWRCRFSEAGDFTMYATAQNDLTSLDLDVRGSIEFTVLDAPVPVTNISWSGPTSIEVGDRFEISAIGLPTTADDRRINLSILEGYFLVDLDYEIMLPGDPLEGVAVAPGTFEVRGTAEDGYGFSDTFTMEIIGPEIQYTLDYNAMGGSGAPPTQTYQSRDTSHTFTISSTEPTRSGYNFLGWSTSSTASTASYQPGGSITIYDDDPTITLWAVWEPIPVTIQITGPTSIEVGESFTLQAQTSGGTGTGGDKTVNWTVTSGSEHVTLGGIQVNNNITGEGASAGQVVFRATSIEDPDVYEEWTLTVTGGDPVTIQITGPTSIEVGESFTLQAQTSGGTGTGGDKTVNWTVTSGSEHVTLGGIQVNNNITGEGASAGQVVFRATSIEDPDVYEEWTLTVTSAGVIIPTTIEITGPGNVMVGDSGNIFASIKPTNAVNRGILWSVTEGDFLIEYETTYRGGMLSFQATGAGVVKITATSTADSSVTATYTLTILSSDAPENQGTLNINNVIQALADSIFGGNTAVAGIVIYAAILLAIFLLIREPLPVVLISIPVTLILRLMRVLDNDLTILLIIISVLGLAMLARNMWRD